MAGATYNYILNEDGQSYSITCKNPTIVDWATIPTVNSADNLPVTRIGDNAFKNCPYLVTVTIGDNITEIGNSAFENCVVLKRIGLRNGILIPNNITSIGNNAFAGCTALERVFVPNGNVSIGDNAFAGCTSLSDMVMLSMTPNNIGENVFDNTPNATIWVYQNCESSYKEASGWVTYADKIEGNNNRINFILLGTKITETYLPYPPDYSTVSSYSTIVGITTAGNPRRIDVGHGTHGLKFYGNILMIANASEALIKGQSNYTAPICPNMLSYATVIGLTENKITLTDEQKATAQTWLGVPNLPDYVSEDETIIAKWVDWLKIPQKRSDGNIVLPNGNMSYNCAVTKNYVDKRVGLYIYQITLNDGRTALIRCWGSASDQSYIEPGTYPFTSGAGYSADLTAGFYSYPDNLVTIISSTGITVEQPASVVRKGTYTEPTKL